MKRSFAALTAGLAVALAGPVLAQDFSKVQIKTTKLSNAVSMMEGAGGNLAVSAGEDTVFLVDDQYAPVTPKIETAIKALSDKPVRFVFNTHWHSDHTGGNENLGKAGAIIVAHDNVRRRMSTEQFLEAFNSRTPASPKVALPVVTFTQSMSFHLNGEEIRIVHVPRAHTDGDSIVHFVGSDVVHMGDTFFNGMYPFIDGSTGGTVPGMLAAADQVIAMTTDKTKIIPGHGPLASRADLQAYRAMLATVGERVKKAVAEGKSNEDIAKLGLTGDFDDKWGKGFLKPADFVTILASIARKGA
jgi:cyclase